MPSVSAMVNKNGFGIIYFGIDDKGRVIGQRIPDFTKKDISDTISLSIEPKI